MARGRWIGLLTLLAIGCGEDRLNIALAALDPAIDRLAVLVLAEGDLLVGASGLHARGSDGAFEIELEQATVGRTLAVAGYVGATLDSVDAPTDGRLERDAIDLALEGEPELPVPEVFASGRIGEGEVRLTDTLAPALTTAWLDPSAITRCSTFEGRTFALDEGKEVARSSRLDAERALVVTTTSVSSHLYEVSIDGPTPITVAGYPSDEKVIDMTVSPSGQLWLVTNTRLNLRTYRNIYSGDLERLERVYTATRTSTIRWIGVSETDARIILIENNGTVLRFHPERGVLERIVRVSFVPDASGSAAWAPGGDLVILQSRGVVRIDRDNVPHPIDLDDAPPPTTIARVGEALILLAGDTLQTRLFEVYTDRFGPVGNDATLRTLSAFAVTELGDGFVVSGHLGFVLQFSRDGFCEVQPGVGGPTTIQHAVTLDDRTLILSTGDAILGPTADRPPTVSVTTVR